jgi:Protein of unknown function (DUF2723)
VHFERISGRSFARRTDALVATAIFVAVLVVYVRTLAPGLTWRNDGADGGDLVAAAASFGIPHPSGYPTYMLLARMFLLLPGEDIAYRLNLMSAVFGAAVAAICYRLCLEQSLRPVSRAARAGAAISSLLLGSSPALWSQATITEVYTLHLFFVAAVLFVMLRWRHLHRLRYAACAGLLMGLGLGNHLTLVLMLPAMLLYFGAEAHTAGVKWRTAVAACMVWLGLGMSVYFYLPVASQLGTNLHWGRIDSPTAFLNHVGSSLYHRYLFALPPSESPVRFIAVAALLVAGYQVWGLLLAGAGYRALWRADRIYVLGLTLIAAGNIVFAVGYNTTDSLRYLLPAWLVAALCIAAGIEAGWDALRRFVPVVRGPEAAFLTFAFLTVGPNLWRYPEFDLSGDDQVAQFSRRMLATLPAGAVALSTTDRQTFALWYLTEVRQTRPDVIVIDLDLLAYDPYRHHLREQWPALQLEDVWRTESVTGSDGVKHTVVQLPQ